MANRIKIAPSILAADFARIGSEVKEAEQAGADYIHVDAMDGQFVPNLTMGPLIAEAVHRSTSVPLDVHLMIMDPERQIEAFRDAGASILTCHVEACLHPHRVIYEIKRAGMRAGMAINPSTPLESVRWILPDLDLLLVMSINPGWGGQKLLPLALPKLREARRLIDSLGLNTEVETDGGIHADNAPDIVRAGATTLVAGTAVFDQGDGIGPAMARLRSAVESAQTGLV
jgi:ribulose-phosphate 3-epimerase